MPTLESCTDEELAAELGDRLDLAQLTPQVGAVGLAIPGLPPFLLTLLKKMGLPRIQAAVAQEQLDDKIPHGGGKALPIGHKENLGECNARGAHGTIDWTKDGDRQA